MEWLRAKLILIVAFAVLDAALAYRLYVQSAPALRPSDLALPSEAQVRAQLEQAGLRLASVLPDPSEAVPWLDLSPRPAPASLVAALIPEPVREGREGTRQVAEGGVSYRWEKGRAWVSREGWVVFTSTARGEDPPGSYAAASARADALAWLARLRALPSDVHAAGEPRYNPQRGGYAVTLQQHGAGGLPLLDGGIQVLMARQGVLGFSWKLWDWRVPERAGPAAVVPATRILVRELREGGVLAAATRSRPDTAGAWVAVVLGYRAEGQRGRLVWRIDLAGGAHDFDAVTGARLPPVEAP